MPRQVFDIKDFQYGIISSMDEEDIPSDSASDSLNVDGDVGEGILRGIPVDQAFYTAGDVALVDARLGEMIEDGGIYYLIYHDKNADKIIGIKDFYNSTVANRIKEDLVTSNISDSTSMVVDKKTVHIGTGIASANVPKWIGKISHYQFGLASADYRDSFSGGAGNDDLTATTTGYGGFKMKTFYVVIDGTGTPDTFRWGIDGVEIATTVAITGSAQTLTDGTYSISVIFGSTTSHAVSDTWYIQVGSIYATNAKLTAPNLSAELTVTATEHTGAGYFTTGLAHNWKLSYVYDGIEESPLNNSDTLDITGASDADYYTIKIRADNAVSYPQSFNRRITGINLYRSDSIDGTYANLGFYRMVASLDINDANWATGAGGEAYSRILNIYDYGTYYSYSAGGTINASPNVTYKENTGMSETITDSSINYSLASVGNGYNFIGKCYHASVPDAERYIFRSKYLRYDAFDWTLDFLVMPEAITAMHFYAGKLFVFSLNKTYRINPDGLYIEDIFDDAGCQGQRAVHSNEFGMFFANSLNAWMYRDGNFVPIGDAIRQSASGGKSWQTFYYHSLTDIIVTSDAKKGYVLFINERDASGDKLFAWAYHPTKQRWDAFGFGGYTSSANTGAFKGKNGEVYLSYATATQQLMRPAAVALYHTQAWEWYSQELSFGETRQVKSLTMIKLDATGTVAITYGVDGVTPSTSGTSDALINVYNKSIRLKLTGGAVSAGSAYTNYADSLELIYRPLIGAR